MTEILLTNAELADGRLVHIRISGGLITEIGPELEIAGEIIDCTGLIAFPGFVDLHTHLREPGSENSETVLTGSRAAAKGGYTAVHAMANTNPVADTAAVVEQIHRLGIEAGYVEVQPIGAVTVALAGERMAELGLMNKSKANVTIFSDDGRCVSNSLLMQRALEYVKGFDGVIAQHAQDPQLTNNSQMNAGDLALRLGLTGWPEVAESSIIARDCLLAEQTGSKLHICHLSTASAVDVIRWAKGRGINVTAEVTPHHLLLTEDLLEGYNSIYKVNPPLRSAADVQALRLAVADGTIDIIATDHAPHPAESKECEFGQAAFGMVGLETAASVAYSTLVTTGLINHARFQQVMSEAPARISGMQNQGCELAPGTVANLTLFDPKVNYTVDLESESKSSNNPFLGLTLQGKVVHTFFRGIQTVRDSKVLNMGEVVA
ncbi:MAG: dihydroorotase [Actinobacteria bacterium]|nr:dihydroorotase [Actinomycetota bacterium]NBY44269.1 dihydroorotase [Micrococcales bacterium]